jgi:asparagine synthase (glutamine-hydrolysing)
VPLDRWIRTELLDSFLEPIRDGTIEKAGILRPEAVAGLLNDHLSGRGDHRHRLWAVLVFIRWLAGQG